jgi:hypothetical protein
MVAPLGIGSEVTVQVEPFHLIARGRSMSDVSTYLPTAMQSDADLHETADS